MINTRVQAIVVGTQVFIGTENGKMRALNTSNGATNWTFTADGPIVSSPTVAGGKVVFGTGVGSVFALDQNNGSQVWRYQTGRDGGFCANPAVSGDNVLLGGRDGYFYNISITSGGVIWQYAAAVLLMLINPATVLTRVLPLVAAASR